MEVSVVIVNYKVKYFLEQTLRSVYESLDGMDSEVFVIDNNSEDDSIEFLRQRFPNVIFIENDKNVGFSRANNIGIEKAQGKYTLILNPDTIIGSRTIKDCIKCMEQHNDCGAVGVNMHDGDGVFLPESKRSFPTPWVSFCKIFGLSKLFPNSPTFAKYHLRYLDRNKVHQIDILSGAFMFIRTDILKSVKGFDTDFFMYGEDIDLSYRLTQKGYKNYYIPTPIIHYKGESTKKNSLRYVKNFYEAMIIFFRKHYPHYSTIYSFIIKTAIWLKASLDAVKNIVIKPVANTNIIPSAEHSVWGVVSAQPDEVEKCISEKNPNSKFIVLDNANKIAEFISNNNTSVDIILDNRLLNYTQIIDTIVGNTNNNVSFHIYSSENSLIITPKAFLS